MSEFVLMNALPDIPRLYTAIAEWAACLIYILLVKKRYQGKPLVGIVSLGFFVLCAIQITAGIMPLAMWVPGMITAVCGMFGFIFLCCDSSARDAGYLCARAFILAEFAASLNWQLYCYFFTVQNSQINAAGILFCLIVYALVFTLMYFFERRHMEKDARIGVTSRQLWSVAAITISIFIVGNISFVGINTPFSSRLIPELFYIRTLVNFCGLLILYVHQEQRREMQLQRELEAMQSVLQRQFEQYRLSKESIELINLKYHDVKHHIAIIRAETNSERQASYLDEMEEIIRTYEAQNKTGNDVLDTVLTSKSLQCQKNNITLTCVADGTLLDFMEVIDICSIFGNALDNAIENVIKVGDIDKRLIRVGLYAQNSFLIMRFENYYEGELRINENGLPLTTKEDIGYHGFGLKSIQHTVEKYGGSMTVNTEDNWFYLRVLLRSPHLN